MVDVYTANRRINVSLLCGLGIHKWHFCKCTRCGKTRAENHEWKKHKCKVCGIIDPKVRYNTREVRSRYRKNVVGGQKGIGCKCSAPKVPLNTSEVKLKSLKCAFGIHEWSGCECSLCGKTRNKNHVWENCKCKVCGGTRDWNHVWEKCKCKVCGKTAPLEAHHWSALYGSTERLLRGYCYMCNMKVPQKCPRCGGKISGSDDTLYCFNDLRQHRVGSTQFEGCGWRLEVRPPETDEKKRERNLHEIEMSKRRREAEEDIEEERRYR